MNVWELVPEGERYSDRSANGAMLIPVGSFMSFLPTRAASPKRVLLRARGISRRATSPNFSSLRVVSVDSLAPPGKSSPPTNRVLGLQEPSAFVASRSFFQASKRSQVSSRLSFSSSSFSSTPFPPSASFPPCRRSSSSRRGRRSRSFSSSSLLALVLFRAFL